MEEDDFLEAGSTYRVMTISFLFCLDVLDVLFSGFSSWQGVRYVV